MYERSPKFEQQVDKADANSMLSVSQVKKAQPIEETEQTDQGAGDRLIEHLLCFHGRPRDASSAIGKSLPLVYH